MSSLPFIEFPKIPRLKRTIIIMEKIDGTNGQILIRNLADTNGMFQEAGYDVRVGDWLVRAGSRSRWVSPISDNFGFAGWVHQNAATLVHDLGAGTHFGEWWGLGIQRGYGLTERRFSLFNTTRWTRPFETPRLHVVPTLYHGPFTVTDGFITLLAQDGSVAAPGFMDPEGIIVYHVASRHMFKQTVLKDEEHKGVQK